MILWYIETDKNVKEGSVLTKALARGGKSRDHRLY